MASHLSLVAGGAFTSLGVQGRAPAKAGVQTEREARAENAYGALRAFRLLPSQEHILSELFATHPRDAGWCGFLLYQSPRAAGPVLWVQERMAILESGRIFPPGLPVGDLIHVEARDARAALWAMEEGLRCPALSLVIGEIWGDPAALDFTATRRLAVAAERSGVAACLVRLGGHPNLSGARQRWRIASSPSAPNPLDPKAPGAPAWDAELFRARGHPPGRWRVSDEPAQEPDPVRRFPYFVDGPVEPAAGSTRRSA
ncbi:MAG: hypothetical protein ABIS39_06215 [Sphingomicrobium sp.]